MVICSKFDSAVEKCCCLSRAGPKHLGTQGKKIQIEFRGKVARSPAPEIRDVVLSSGV